jgi:hypothetical protein
MTEGKAKARAESSWQVGISVREKLLNSPCGLHSLRREVETAM